jgi:hypothetical protein
MVIKLLKEAPCRSWELSMNKIDQTKLAVHVLDKIKEVNEEAGHRTYLEVPEMIRIICEAVEENYHIIPVDWEAVKKINL